ncbi:hypothetical protein F5X98DRAFT_203694 [Xylaria grammica]|nr:hypothetical protein F5X98DRAFT_203694 [Xylaria grammica]
MRSAMRTLGPPGPHWMHWMHWMHVMMLEFLPWLKTATGDIYYIHAGYDWLAAQAAGATGAVCVKQSAISRIPVKTISRRVLAGVVARVVARVAASKSPGAKPPVLECCWSLFAMRRRSKLHDCPTSSLFARHQQESRCPTKYINI